MLSYISSKFSQEIPQPINEPRAALFLNRFSRTLAIMYATNGLADTLGISADRLIGKSFYFCIQENCLREAVKCLESAKANDSIAYLRFWYRDPTQNSRQNSTRQDEDDRMTDGNSSGDDDDGGVHLAEMMEQDESENAIVSDSSNSMRSSSEPQHPGSLEPNSRSSSGNSTDMDGIDPVFDPPANGQSSRSSVSSPDRDHSSNQSWSPEEPQIELEAVVSCTSDGLVVILRRAKPFVPNIAAAVASSAKSRYSNGLFASPWANDPIMPIMPDGGNSLPDAMRRQNQTNQIPVYPTLPVPLNPAEARGPASEDFMNTIRDVAVFAWSLTGINGSLKQYGRGTPSGESLPSNGYPVWDPYANAGPEGYSTGDKFTNGLDHTSAPGGQFDHHKHGHNNGTNGYGSHSSDESLHKPSSFTNQMSQPMYGNHEAQTLDHTNGHLSNNTKGYHGQERQANNRDYNQSLSHGKATYSDEPLKNIQAMTAGNGHSSSNGFTNGPRSTEYDPFAPTTYQAPPGSNHTSPTDSYTSNGWHVNPVVPPQSNGYHH